MTTPAFTTAIDPNVPEADVAQTLKYQQRFIEKWNSLVEVGDEVTLTCDGVTADNTDRLSAMDPGDLVWGDIGDGVAGEAACWGVIRFGTQYLLMIAKDTASGDPFDVSFRLASQPYSLASGSDPDIRPTIADTARETTELVKILVPATGDSVYNKWQVISHQRMLNYSKLVGADDSHFAIITHRPAPGEAAADQQSFGFTFGAFANLSVGEINTASNWLAHDADGTALAGTMTPYSVGWNFTSWPTGQAANLRGRLFGLFLGANGATTSAARFLGTLYDIKGVPTLTPVNSSDPDDTGSTHIYRSIGDIAHTWLRTDGDLV